MDGITDEGKKRFGKFLQHCIESNYTSRSEAAIAIQQATDIAIPETKLTELIHAQWISSFKFDHIVALVASGILKFDDGTPLDYNDVMEVWRGRLDPFTRERLGNGVQKPV